MLTLTLKKGTILTVGDATIHIDRVSHESVKVSIEAPKHINILRSDAKCKTPPPGESKPATP